MRRKNDKAQVISVGIHWDIAEAFHHALKLLSLSILLFPSLAFAFPDIPSTSKHQLTQEEPLADTIAIFGDDDRRTEEQFALENKMSLSEVQNRYAATGILTCEGSELTANLTLVNNLVVTSAHGFNSSSTCEQESKPSSCTFSVKIGNVTKKQRVQKLMASGFRCPARPANGDDWAVLKLENKIEGVMPYSVTGQLVDEESRVTSVNAMARDSE